MEAVRQFRQRGDGVDRGIENELGPLRRPRVAQSDSLEAGRADQLGGFLNDSEGRVRWLKWAHPGCSIEFVLNVRVAVARATHKSGAANHKSFSEGGDNFLAAKAVLRGENSAVFEKMGDRPHGFSGLRGFAGNNAQIEFRQAGWVLRGMQLGVKLMRSGYSQPIAIQCLGVFGTPHKSPHLGDLRQVRGVEASDRAAPDDANAFDQLSDSRTRGSRNWTCIRPDSLPTRMFDANHGGESTGAGSL